MFNCVRDNFLVTLTFLIPLPLACVTRTPTLTPTLSEIVHKYFVHVLRTPCLRATPRLPFNSIAFAWLYSSGICRSNSVLSVSL